jgi:hypothetical protein
MVENQDAKEQLEMDHLDEKDTHYFRLLSCVDWQSASAEYPFI